MKVKRMGKAKRKPRPQPPKWVWLDLDGCWFCKNRRNCSNCKVLKNIVANEKRKERKHDVKRDC